MNPPVDGLEVRWFDQKDLPQMVDVHSAAFPAEAWTPADFFKFVDNRSGRNNVAKVLAGPGGPGGVVYGTLLYTVEADAIRFRRVAVRPDVRRRGLAAFTLRTLCGPASPLRRRLFLARVLEDNVPGQLLFRGVGFVFDGRRPRDVHVSGKEYYEFTYVKPGGRLVVADV